MSDGHLDVDVGVIAAGSSTLHYRQQIGRGSAPHHEGNLHMNKIPTRLLLGFVAGLLAHLIFQGAFGSMLYAAHLVPALPWSLAPVPPFGVPKTLSLGFWAGLWGLAYALLERRLTARFGWWLGGLVFGLASLVAYWFVVLPLKGMGVGGGFHPAMVPIEVGFHAAFGIGTAIIFRYGLALARRKAGASREATNR